VIEYFFIWKSLKVLVVDDEVDSREFIATVLQECQAEVTAVSSAQEALEMLNLWTPDVLISDIGMPGENGYSLIRKVRSLSCFYPLKRAEIFPQPH
jgi:CheY-like chemotaxis protein